MRHKLKVISNGYGYNSTVFLDGKLLSDVKSVDVFVDTQSLTRAVIEFAGIDVEIDGEAEIEASHVQTT